MLGKVLRVERALYLILAWLISVALTLAVAVSTWFRADVGPAGLALWVGAAALTLLFGALGWRADRADPPR